MTESQTSSRFMYLVHRTRVATADAMNAELADLGLNGTLALILETLFEGGEMSAAELARRCLVTRQALTAPLNDLQGRGLVQRPESSTAVRVRPIILTAAGRELTRVARRRVRKVEQESIAGFDAAEAAQLRQLLDRYAAAWERLAPAGRPVRAASL